MVAENIQNIVHRRNIDQCSDRKSFRAGGFENQLLAIGPAEIAVFVVAGAGVFQSCFAVESIKTLFDIKSFVGIIRSGIAFVVDVFRNLDFYSAEIIDDLPETVEIESDIIVDIKAGDFRERFFEIFNAISRISPLGPCRRA